MTLEISDSALNKLHTLLKRFSDKEIEIIDDEIVGETEMDFIDSLVNNPIQLKNGTVFFSREEAG